MPPMYSPEHYRHYYYGQDFDEIKARFTEDDHDITLIRKYGTDFFNKLKERYSFTEPELHKIRHAGVKQFEKVLIDQMLKKEKEKKRKAEGEAKAKARDVLS